MSAIRSQPYSRQGRSNWDDIFGKKPQVELLCSHRDQTGEFCRKHQGGCGLHAYHEPDGHCECKPCDPKPAISNVRYAGVCECEIYQHCAKCDPEAFGSISDGFGSVWSKKCPTCQQDTMEVVRPGKVQCTNCG